MAAEATKRQNRGYNPKYDQGNYVGLAQACGVKRKHSDIVQPEEVVEHELKLSPIHSEEEDLDDEDDDCSSSFGSDENLPLDPTRRGGCKGHWSKEEVRNFQINSKGSRPSRSSKAPWRKELEENCRGAQRSNRCPVSPPLAKGSQPQPGQGTLDRRRGPVGARASRKIWPTKMDAHRRVTPGPHRQTVPRTVAQSFEPKDQEDRLE